MDNFCGYGLSRIVAAAAIANRSGYDRAFTYGYDYGPTAEYGAPVLAAVTFPRANDWGYAASNPIFGQVIPVAGGVGQRPGLYGAPYPTFAIPRF